MGHVPTCSLVLGVIELFKASSLTLTAVDALRARRIFARPKILYKFFIAYTVTSVRPNKKPSDESDYIFILLQSMVLVSSFLVFRNIVRF